MNEHDFEPVRGLPALLPEGETILWQGAPRWKTFARRAMRVRLMTGYFAALLIWGIVSEVKAGSTATDITISTVRLAALAAVAIGLLALFAWLVARTTLYTITTRRVVIRFGIALPITIQMPFRMIEAAGVHTWADGTGDIALKMVPSQRIAYLVMWPHARPWKLASSQPSLRGIADAAAVAQILARALAVSASQPATTIRVPISISAATDSRIAAAA